MFAKLQNRCAVHVSEKQQKERVQNSEERSSCRRAVIGVDAPNSRHATVVAHRWGGPCREKDVLKISNAAVSADAYTVYSFMRTV